MLILAAADAVHSALSGLAAAGSTPTPSPSPTGGFGPAAGHAIGSVLGWLGRKSGIGVIGVLAVLAGGGWLLSQMPAPARKEAAEGASKAAKGLLGVLGRLLTGRPLSARAAERKRELGGRFWSPAARPFDSGLPVAQLGSIALPAAGPAVEPLEWLYARVEKLLGWLGDRAELPNLAGIAVDLAVTVGLWLLDAARWTLKGLRGVWALPRAVVRAALAYGRWRGAEVLALRVGAPAAAIGLYAAWHASEGWTVAGVAATGLGAAVAAFTGPGGHDLWHAPRRSDDLVYGGALWSMLKAELRLPADAEKHRWLSVPHVLEEPGAQIVLRLPESFLGSERERAGLDEIVNLRLPGDWVSEWLLMGGGHRAVWTAKRTDAPLEGDAAQYAPALWPILRDSLGLPKDAVRDDWLSVPADLADDAAVVRLLLPLSFVGAEMDRQTLTTLINLRLPGDWAARWSVKAGQADGDHWVEWTHRPPAPPAPEPPDAVDINDPRVLAALADLDPDEFLFGLDEHHHPVVRRLSGETPHMALSVGTGGGKSAKLQWLAVQMVMKRGTIFGIDPKMLSLKPLRDVPGVHLYADPQNALDMRRLIEWLAEVTEARFFEKEQGIRSAFDPIYLILEESNELVILLKQAWENVRVKKGEDKDSVADPIWREDVGKILRLGRDANVHIIAVFQDFKDNEFGGASLTPLFRIKALGNYEETQWKRIFGRVPMPPSVNKAGRMAIVKEGKAVRYQVPFTLDALNPPQGKTVEETSGEIYHRLYLDLRERYGYEPDGLYGEPPANSPRGVPRLLRGRVSPMAAHSAQSPESGLSAGIVPGQRVTLHKGDGLYDASHDGGSDSLRDALESILAPRGQGGAQQAQVEPEEPLLSLAEISRRFEEQGITRPANTMSAHKRRHDDFPQGIGPKGKVKYRFSEIEEFYKRREESAAKAQSE